LLRDGETENGPLFRLTILRDFRRPWGNVVEAGPALHSHEAWRAADVLTGIDMVSYAPFPVEPGPFGAVYEIRT